MSNNNNLKDYWISISIIGALFFIFGFITWLNGILIPYLKIACELNNFQSLLVTFAFYISYFFMALPSSWVLNKTGLKNGMMVALFIMAIGALIFIPAAYTRTYFLFLLGIFILGTGLAILQTASNPYITIIGPRESAATRISIMGICNKIAGALAPLVLAYFVFSDGDLFIQNLAKLEGTSRIEALDQLASRVIGPYIFIAISLFALGVMVKLSPLPELETENSNDIDNEDDTSKHNIFQFPHLWFGAIALFFYVGVEVIAGDTIIRYALSLNISIESAKIYTTYTLLAMVAGYVFFGLILIPKILSQRKALVISSVLGILLTILAIFSSSKLSVFFIALLGFANAIMWPAIWPLAIHNLGKFLKSGSSLLIMAIAGGAIMPLAWGKLLDIFKESPQNAYWVCVPCYLVILLFGTWGYKLKNKSNQ